MHRALITLGAALALSACASQIPMKPQVVYQDVKVKTPVSCVPAEVPGVAATSFETRQSLAAVPEGPERYARTMTDWLARLARMDQTEPVVASCKRVAPPG